MLTFVDELVFLIFLKNMLGMKLVNNNRPFLISFGFMDRNNLSVIALKISEAGLRYMDEPMRLKRNFEIVLKSVSS